jgi:hypothetical protein
MNALPPYEVSTRGDKRFSALCAIMPDGRTLEMHYQCDVKGFNPGGRNWRDYKGKHCSLPWDERFTAYCNLWRTYLDANPHLWPVLTDIVAKHRLTDMFARPGALSQAHALTHLAKLSGVIPTSDEPNQNQHENCQ